MGAVLALICVALATINQGITRVACLVVAAIHLSVPIAFNLFLLLR